MALSFVRKFMSSRLKKITAAVICFIALGFAALHFLSGMSYSLESKSQSPNGKLTIHVFQSLQDGFGHAPYGQILAISRKSQLSSPDDGYVFFAGYCKSLLSSQWKSDNHISVRCIDGNKSEGPRTLASVAYSIKIDYTWQ